MAEVVVDTVHIDRVPSGASPVMVSCSFHDDRTPSLAVYADHAYCFGACQKSWDVFAWVLQRDQVSFLEACDRLARERDIPRPHWTPKEETKAQQEQAERELLHLAVDYYATRLQAPEGQSALAFARSRGLTDNTIREYHLGLADGSLRAHLEAIGGDINLARGVGLIREDGRDHFYGRLVFPFLRGGRVTYLVGRTLTPDSHPKYLNLPGQKQVFRNSQAQHCHGQPLMLVEGVLDAIALGQNGFAAVALNGTTLLSQDVGELKRYATVYIMLDDDDAGHAGIARNAEVLGPLTRVIRLPEGADDPAAWFRAGATADDVRHLMKTAMPWLEVRRQTICASKGSSRQCCGVPRLG